MRFRFLVWGLTLSALLVGCAPAVSLQPLYTPQERAKPVAEPRIEGEWISPFIDEPGKDQEEWLHWMISREESGGQWLGYYKVELRPGKPESHEEPKVTTYHVRLVSAGDKLFFDADFEEHAEGQNKIGRDDALGLIPTHLPGRLRAQQDFLRISLLNSSWVEENKPDSFKKMVHTGSDTDVAVITGSTEELRNFFVQNADNAEAFPREYVAYLCRPGADCVLRAYEDMLANTPDDDELLGSAAIFFLDRGNYARAAELRRRRVELKPENGPLHSELGNALLLKREFDGARSEFAAAEKLAPGEWFAPEGVVWSYFVEGKFSEAAAAAANYEATKKHASVDPILLGYFSLLRLGRREEAGSWLKERTAQYAGEAEGHIVLLGVQGRINAGCPWLPAAVAKEPEREWCWFGQAMENIAKGKSAKWELDRLVDGAPKNSLTALAARIELERFSGSPKK